MNIREWFGCAASQVTPSEFTSKLEELLTLYAKALSKYFGVREAKSAQDMISLASQQELSNGNKYFLDWFSTEGISIVKNTLNRSLPESTQLINQFEYVEYILEGEMDLQYPENLRSALISTLANMDARIENAKK